MQGHVTKRGPATPDGPARKRPWAFVLEVGDHADGRRRQVLRSGFVTKREAQEALREEIQRRAAGVVVDPGRLTVGQFLQEQWLPGLSRVRESTHRSYTQHARTYLVPLLGGRPLRDLSTPDVNLLTAALGKPTSLGGRGLQPATVRLVHATLRAALADAVRWGLLPSNVALGAQLPQRRRPEMRVWSAEQVRAFLKIYAEDELGPVLAVIAHTGLRRGEAVGLRWRQVDLDRALLVVDHQLVENGYRNVSSGEPKTKRGRRVLSLDPGTVALLGQQKRRQERQHADAGLPQPPEWVFTRADGGHLHPEQLTRRFPRMARRADLPVIRLHDLRHTHATLGLAAGIPAKVMADRLGHSSVLLTLDTYSHVSPALDAAAAELIARLVSGQPATPRDPEVIHDLMSDLHEEEQ